MSAPLSQWEGVWDTFMTFRCFSHHIVVFPQVGKLALVFCQILFNNLGIVFRLLELFPRVFNFGVNGNKFRFL
jgi:hypothetical protein